MTVKEIFNDMSFDLAIILCISTLITTFYSNVEKLQGIAGLMKVLPSAAPKDPILVAHKSKFKEVLEMIPSSALMQIVPVSFDCILLPFIHLYLMPYFL